MPGTLPERLPDGGLAVVAGPNNNHFVYFLAGGEADSNGIPGVGFETNRLYFGQVDYSGATPAVTSPFVQIADFELSDNNNNAEPGPVLVGLASLDGELYTAQRRYNGAFAFRPDRDSAIIQIAFDRGSSSGGGFAFPAYLMELPNADIHTVTGAQSRGSIFAAALVNPENATSNQYQNLAILEIDPRVSDSPYIRNTFWGAAGDFNIGTNTTVGATFNPALHDQVAKVGGAAFSSSGNLVLNAFADLGTSGGNPADRNGFFLTVNPDRPTARGPGGGSLSQLVALDGGGGMGTIGMSGVQGLGGSIPPPTLDDSPGGRDYSIGSLFGKVSYSGAALGSGVIQQVYRQRFIETSRDPVFCSIDGVIAQIPAALLANVNKTQGIARTTHALRHALEPGHPCEALTPP